MSEEMIVRHCSPTLAGLKAGSLFSCRYEEEERLKAEIRRQNRKLVQKGLRMLPLKMQEGLALIYLYRPALLAEDLGKKAADALLRERGYGEQRSERCVLHLMSRLAREREFPHEIGLFLGYPPEDVRGFIENKEAYKCVGNWKVYGDAEAARKRFAQYKKCTDTYCARLAQGCPLEMLTMDS